MDEIMFGNKRLKISISAIIQFLIFLMMIADVFICNQLFAQDYNGTQTKWLNSLDALSKYSPNMISERKHPMNSSRTSSALLFVGMSSNSSNTDTWIFNVTYYKKVQKRLSVGFTLNVIGGPAGFLLHEPKSYDLEIRNNDIIISEDLIVVFDDVNPPDTSSLGIVTNHALKYNVWSPEIEFSLIREKILLIKDKDQVGIVYGISAGFILFRPNYYVITERYTYLRDEQLRSRGDTRDEGWYYFDSNYTKERKVNIVPKIKIVGGYRVQSIYAQYGVDLAVELLFGYQFSGSVTRNTKQVDYLENITADFNGVFLTTNFGLAFN